MKKLLLATLLLALSAPAFSYSLTLSCSPITTYTDGTTIASGTTVTYKFYGAVQGQALQLLTPTGLSTCQTVRTNVNPGTACYAAVASINGQDSAQTTPACFTVPAIPSTPGGMTVTPVTVATTAYMELQVPNGFSFLAVGTVPLGTPCDATQRVNNFNVVPAASVIWTSNIHRLAALAACSVN